MRSIYQRSRYVLNLDQYGLDSSTDELGKIELDIPNDRQYVLRMLIKKPFTEFLVPDELQWCKPMIDKCYENQLDNGIRQPFVYLTVRSGHVDSINDDVWHVDGFSMNVSHLPEQNYIWADKYPTEIYMGDEYVPSDFNPYKHNIHQLFQDIIGDKKATHTCSEKHIHVFDPYVIHRRNPESNDKYRTFVRVSFCPMEIDDLNNTYNELIPTNYTRDGVTFRDTLERYAYK
jgi:hypothetical protein